MVVGGQTDEADRFISPTILNGCTRDDPVMQVYIYIDIDIDIYIYI